MDADLNDVTDYVLALVANKRSKEVMIEELGVFMEGHAEEFVDKLMGRIQSTLTAAAAPTKTEEEEIEVDFEEDETVGSGSERGRPSSVLAAGRKLREYSPERAEQSGSSSKKSFSDALEERAKIPCSNFQRFGKCRFGDACHYAHVPPRSSRLRLESLPSELQSPETLVQQLKPFGSILAVHMEAASAATIQFSTADEAEAALNSGIFPESVQVSLVQRKPPQHQQQSKPQQRSTLPELYELQKKQQALLTRCIADQKTLLTELDAEGLDDEVKAAKMEALSKLSQTCTSVQQMLKSTAEMILEAKTQQQQAVVAEQRRPAPLPRRPAKYHHQPYKTAAPVVHANRSLDLRPSTLRLTDLSVVGETRDIHAMQRFFSPFGSILSLKFVDNGEAALVKYERHADAKRAFESINNEALSWEDHQQQQQ